VSKINKCSKLARIRKCIKKFNKKTSNHVIQENATHAKKINTSPLDRATGSSNTEKNNRIACQLPESYMLKNVHRPVVSETDNLQTQISREILVEIPVENGKNLH
jgi:hypothetical protein